MELRNGSLVGGSPGQLSAELRPTFEHGVGIILRRWTALCLAVENEWGGRESKDKAEHMYQDILAFFYENKEHYADDLEVDLEEIMLADFNTQVEDDSPRQISKELVSLHNELISGQKQTLERLQQAGAAGTATSTRQTLDRDGTLLEGDNSSSSDEEDSDEEMGDRNGSAVQEEKAGPIIDEDGFQLVQNRRGGKGR